MTRVDLLVTAPHVLTMAGPGVGYQADAALAVDRGRIVAIGPRAEVLPAFQAEQTIVGDHHVVLPGLIDAHLHSGLALLRGLAQDTRHWMMYGLEPFRQQLDAAALEAGSRLALLEAVRNGTTTLGDYGQNMDGVCRFIEQVGARGRVTVLIREAVQRIYEPAELYQFDRAQGERQLAEAQAVFDRWHGAANGRITVLFGPQGPDFLSAELLLRVRDEACRRGVLAARRPERPGDAGRPALIGGRA